MDEGMVSIEKAGRIYSGRWRMERGVLTLSAPSGMMTAELKGSVRFPSGLARKMLRELIDDEARKASA